MYTVYILVYIITWVSYYHNCKTLYFIKMKPGPLFLVRIRDDQYKFCNPLMRFSKARDMALAKFLKSKTGN